MLLLPWQTRWFWDASLAGWPWEQGRLSLYVSWAILFATIVVGWRQDTVPRLQKEKKILVLAGIVCALSLLATRGNVDAMKAVMQWWVQIVLLALFVDTVRRASVPRMSIATWVVLALLPHAGIGLWQYAVQRVDGSTLLGMSAHVPETPGTSVVEHGMYRVLRIYGGFPHPNIFGGWLAIGVLTAFGFAAKASTKMQAAFAAVSSAVLSVALLLTYSRSAWLAVACGAIVWSIHLVRTKRVNQFVLVSVAASLLATTIVGVSQRDHVFARANTASRLETMSIDARRQSLREGWRVFLSHPLVGTGPNAELLLMGDGTPSKQPLEPPHMVFLLALVNVGILGCALIMLLIVRLVSRSTRLLSGSSFFATIFPLLVVGLFDHYLWSLWSGQSLVAAVMLLACSVERAS